MAPTGAARLWAAALATAHVLHTCAGQTAWDVLQGRSDVGTTRGYLAATGLDLTLQDATQQLTVFVPTEAAWEALGRGGQEYLRTAPAELDTLMRMLIVNGSSLNTAQAAAASPLTPMLNNGVDTLVVTATSGGGTIVNGVTSVVIGDIPATNGQVHLINRALIPTGSGVPTKTVLELVEGDASLTTLSGYLSSSPLRVDLGDSGNLVTFIAPSNAAFASLTPLQLTELVTTSGLLQRVLNNHASNTHVSVNTVANADPLLLPTYDAPNVLVYTKSPGPNVNATLFVSARPAINGVLITVDRLLAPVGTLIPSNIMDVILAHANLTSTAGGLQAAGLDAVLEQPNKFTVLAPSDAAWAALSSGAAGLLARDASAAQSVLAYHIVAGEFTLLDLQTAGTVTTTEGTQLTLTAPLVVNGVADIVQYDIPASNGYVHIISSVLRNVRPLSELTDIVAVVGNYPSRLARAYSAILATPAVRDALAGVGPLTLLAPSDAAFAELTQAQVDALLGDVDRLTRLLLYHTLVGYFSVADLAAQQQVGEVVDMATVEGSVLRKSVLGGLITFTDDSGREGLLDRAASDRAASNGIVHVVDAFLLPPGDTLPGHTVADIIAARGDAAGFNQLVLLSGIRPDLVGVGPFTVFAPQDSAFAALGSGVLEYLYRNTADLQRLVLHHTSSAGGFTAAQLPLLSPLASMEGGALSVTPAQQAQPMLINGVAAVVVPDLAGSNGYVHVVDGILPPQPTPYPTATLYDIATTDPRLTAYADMVAAGGGEVYLKSAGPLTAFAVRDDEFLALEPATRSLLLGDSLMLAEVIRYNLAQGYYAQGDLVTTSPSTLPTLHRPDALSYAVSSVTQRVLVDGLAEIVDSIAASNGMLHVLSGLLVPDGLLPTAPPSVGNTLYDVIDRRLDTTAFAELVKQAGLFYLLTPPAPRLTVLAPNDAALAKLPTGHAALFQRIPELLTDVAKYHVLIDGSFAASVLPATSPARTAQGAPMLIKLEALRVTINGEVDITVADIPASNGVLHVIDGLLVPPGSPLPRLNLRDVIAAEPTLSQFYGFMQQADLASVLEGPGALTVFAPSNAALQVYPELLRVLDDSVALRELLRYHVHEGYADASDLVAAAPGSLRTLEGGALAFTAAGTGSSVVLANTARIARADVRATNGVLHVIDSVLPYALPVIPDDSLQDVLAGRADTTDFAATTASVGLFSALSAAPGSGSVGPYTVFAPSNVAWSEMPEGVKRYLAGRLDVLTNIMRYHVIQGVGLTAVSAPQASPAETMQGNVLTMAYDPATTQLRVDTATALYTNIRASNGVAHVINEVLDYPGSPLPKLTAFKVINTRPELTKFAAILRAAPAMASLLDTISGGTVYTVLAPTDAAFDALPDTVLQGYLTNPDAVVRAHVVPTYRSAAQFASTSPGVLGAMNGEQVTYRTGASSVGGTTLDSTVTFNYESPRATRGVVYDIPATNGIVHAIDGIVSTEDLPTAVPSTLAPPTLAPPPPPPTDPILVWGDTLAGGDAQTVASVLNNVQVIVGNDAAFAAVVGGGNLVAWGDPLSGGTAPQSANTPGASRVESIAHTRSAFAARRADGSVLAWGEARAGGDAATVGASLGCCVESIAATSRAFAAVKSDGSVVAWGDAIYGGAIPATTIVPPGIKEISANTGAFAAKDVNGGVTSWGIPNQGGDSAAARSQLLSNVRSIANTYAAFAALKADGTVAAWGDPSSGGDAATVAGELTNVISVASTSTAFAAVRGDGRVVTWGGADGGGDPGNNAPALSNVVSVASTGGAFAAMRSDGTVVTWGGSGGDSTTVQPLTGVRFIRATDSAFAAVKLDGSVVTWGSPGYGGVVDAAKQPLLANVVEVYGNERAFAAARADGSVVAWGSASSGGSAGLLQTALLAPSLDRTPRVVASTKTAFAAYTPVPATLFTPTPRPLDTPVPSGGGVAPRQCNLLTCNGNHLSFRALPSDVCRCECKPNYAGVYCEQCAPGRVRYPFCEVPPTPVPVPATPTPAGGGFATPLPGNLPLPTTPPTSCLIWTDCNGHAASVTTSPLTGACVCDCLPSFAGATCDVCAAGYVNYPACSKGTWVLVSDSRACAMNVESDQAVYGADTDLLPTLLACQQSCAQRDWCRAVDWYASTQTCTMYASSCADPQDPFSGASHWRLVVKDVVDATPAPVVVTPAPEGCPWVSSTGRVDEYDCKDGTTCDAVRDGDTCCRTRRGRLRCPANRPIMCAAVSVECGEDYCCVAEPAACAVDGGPRPCRPMDVTPCGAVSEGGGNSVFTSQSRRILPRIDNVVALYANDAAYTAVHANGSATTWGAGYSGGDSSAVAGRLAGGVVKVFNTDKSFAALKSDGSVVTWGDNGLGQDTSAVDAQLANGVVTITATSNAYAALKASGAVVTWGHRYYGAESATVAGRIAAGVQRVYANRQAFAAVLADNSVVTWGAPNEGGGDSSLVAAQLAAAPGVAEVYASESAFAALRRDGSVVTWGYPTRGGDSSTVRRYLSRDVTAVYATRNAFAAVKTNRSVVVWGDPASGGDASTVAALLRAGVERVYTTDNAFLAVRVDGSGVAWGSPQHGGAVPDAVAREVYQIDQVAATAAAFTVIRRDRTAVVWGDPAAGGTPPATPPLTNVQAVHANAREFAALLSSGDVVTWTGSRPPASTEEYVTCETALEDVVAYTYGLGIRSVAATTASFAFLTEPDATPAPVAPGVAPTPPDASMTDEFYRPLIVWGDPQAGGLVDPAFANSLTCGDIKATARAFAAVKADGSVVAWGDPGYGGDATTVAVRVRGGITDLFATSRAFAAVTERGSVVTWGDRGYGGYVDERTAARLSSDVIAIYATQLAFAAVKRDGSVVAWGDRYYGGDTLSVDPFLECCVAGIYSTDQAFAALRTDGSVVTWGAGFAGADSSAVRTQLRSGVIAVYNTYSAFAAVKTGGSVVTWGYPGRGGDSSTVAGDLLSGVVSVASTEMAFAALVKQQGSSAAGRVVTWGDAGYGGDAATVAAALSSGVTGVYATERAFAALKTDGRVVAWGNQSFGGYAAQLAAQLVDVEEIYASQRAFAALLKSGRVVAWGSSGYGGRWTSSQTPLTNVRVVYATDRAFAALRADGSIVSWGNAEYGGDAAAARGGLAGGGHTAVYATSSAFAALPSCPLGSQLRSVGAGACLDARGRRYSELKTSAVDRAACMQVLLRFAPPARGVTWWPAAPGMGAGMGGCYLAVDEGTTVVGGDWSDRYSFDTNPTVATSAGAPPARDATGPVVLSDSQDGMECVAAVDIAAVPTPPPATPAPTLPPTPAPADDVWSWALTSSSAACEINREQVQPDDHRYPVADLEACLATCAVRDGCMAADYYESGWCNLYATPCLAPMDTRAGAQSWRRTSGVGAGYAVVAWGDPASGGDASSVLGDLATGVRGVYANDAAFAAVRVDGTVVTWGRGYGGGDSGSVAAALRGGALPPIQQIAGSRNAFAAVTSGGDVVAWGQQLEGGSTATVAGQLTDVKRVYASDAAFAAVTRDGRVVAWGKSSAGGDTGTVNAALSVGGGASVLQATATAFAALRADGRVVAWGDPAAGGDATTVALDLAVPTRRVVEIAANNGAFAAIRDDGSVVTWGDAGVGGDSATVAALLASGVRSIATSGTAFAALKEDGTVVGWGDARAGGAGPPVGTQNVQLIVPGDRAFAAVVSDGSVVAWGDPTAGGSLGAPVLQAAQVVGAARAFAAVRATGELAAWGDPAGGGALPQAAAAAGVGMRYLAATSAAFAAVGDDESLVAWGDPQAGGQATLIASRLAPGVVSLTASDRAFAALVRTTIPRPDLGSAVSPVGHCAEELWVASEERRCVVGDHARGDPCDQREIPGGEAHRYFCEYSLTSARFACVRCPLPPGATPAPPSPNTTPAPVTSTLTPAEDHRAIVCGDDPDPADGVGVQTISCPVDAGALVIVEASYGRSTCEGGPLCASSDASVANCGDAVPCVANMTARVAQLCNGMASCTLRAGGADYPDPCPGLSKYLEVRYHCEAAVCAAESRTTWGRPTGQIADVQADLSCEAVGGVLVVSKAGFGRTTCDGHLCYAYPGSNCATKQCHVDVTTAAQAACNENARCTLVAEAGALDVNDPCPGENKVLSLQYTCQEPLVVAKPGACRDANGRFYREYKKAQTTRVECGRLLRSLHPIVRGATYWEGRGCYLAVDYDAGEVLLGSWDAVDSDDTFVGTRLGKGADVLRSMDMDAPIGAECLIVGEYGSTLAPVPPAGTPAPVVPPGSGRCGDAALATGACLDASNAYYCGGYCCCEEQLNWFCDAADGVCKPSFVIPVATPFPAPVPTIVPPGRTTFAPINDGATFPPSGTGGAGGAGGGDVNGAAGGDDDDGLSWWWWILLVILLLLCSCCAAIAYAYGRRKKDEGEREKEKELEGDGPAQGLGEQAPLRDGDVNAADPAPGSAPPPPVPPAAVPAGGGAYAEGPGSPYDTPYAAYGTGQPYAYPAGPGHPPGTSTYPGGRSPTGASGPLLLHPADAPTAKNVSFDPAEIMANPVPQMAQPVEAQPGGVGGGSSPPMSGPGGSPVGGSPPGAAGGAYSYSGFDAPDGRGGYSPLPVLHSHTASPAPEQPGSVVAAGSGAGARYAYPDHATPNAELNPISPPHVQSFGRGQAPAPPRGGGGAGRGRVAPSFRRDLSGDVYSNGHPALSYEAGHV